MVEISRNTKFLLFGFGPQMQAIMALVTNLRAMATTILGIFSAAKKSPLVWMQRSGFYSLSYCSCGVCLFGSLHILGPKEN